MITIDSRIRRDGQMIGTMKAEIDEEDFIEFILDSCHFIQFKDLNRNFGENFTIPEA